MFFRDLLDIAKKHNLQLVLKSKRNDHIITGQYKKLLVDMEKKKDLIILPYGISPYKVVDASYATVVQPLTSVGFYQEKNKNIIFYDPLSKLHITHSERKNTDLVSGKQNLNKWFDNLKKRS